MPFGLMCPVALDNHHHLFVVRSFSLDLSRVMKLKGHLQIFHVRNVPIADKK